VIDIDAPGFGRLALEHLVLDYNGTIALDGKLLPGVAERLFALAGHLQIHVVTADTFGAAAAQLAELPCVVRVLSKGREPRPSAIMRSGSAQARRCAWATAPTTG
jgi:soluble P-type ATPase